MEPVTGILLERGREPVGLNRMVTVSLAAHVVLTALLVYAPSSWMTHQTVPDHPVMTITLGGGAPGPRAGGMTALGGRPVQTVVPLPDMKRPEAIRPPAAKTPEMTVPVPTRAKAVAKAATVAPVVKEAPADARGRTPTRGAQEAAGSTLADTGGRGQGFGLSTGGGGTGSFLDVADFCCPEYIVTMVELVRRNWNARQEVVGESLMKFTIQRDGRLTDGVVEKSSGFAALDLTAQRALALTRQVPPLPAQFPNASLTVHLNFQYQR